MNFFLLIRYIITSFFIIFIILCLTNPVFAMPTSNNPKYYLIGYKNTLKTDLFTKENNIKIVEDYKNLHIARVLISQKQVKLLKQNYRDHLSFIEKDSYASTKNASNIKPSLEENQYIGFFNAEKFRNNKLYNTYTGKGVKIGVLDTGIDYHHSDLNIKGGTAPVDRNEGTNYMDYVGHGTFVAGIIASRKTGIAPDAEVYAIKSISDSGDGSWSNIIRGIDWAINNKMDILNMSVGTSEYSRGLEEAINKAYEKGIFIVAPVGNNGYDKSSNVTYPAKFKHVFAVGSVDITGKRSNFSSVGNEIDTMAPGQEIFSTSLNNSYDYNSGTSMASPYVAAAAALIKSANPNVTNDEITYIFVNNSIKFGRHYEYGNGILNITSALKSSLAKKEKPAVLQTYQKIHWN
ncbi:S8 family peptidase [Priestia sp. SB1]|uniref:S8 family peptidase n=1 Tax=Priestia sp. SB1 TaxID=3132359 RepID=UPI0031782957